MACEGVDLPCGVAQQIMAQMVTGSQEANQRMRGVFDAVMGGLGETIVANVRNMDPTHSRAVSGVLATPIASPTNQS